MLTPDELVSLSPKATALIAEIREATDKAGDAGGKVTKGEARQIARAALALVGALFIELLD
jgi:hypothetical protein